ncbi:MAG: hypothetical protein KF721_07095 [Ignavibacteriaceae bacterium]|nr:hypothetical protein [Ignavibacteriaceae bacterium]
MKIRTYLLGIAILFIINGCEPELTGKLDVSSQSYSVKSLTKIDNYDYNPLDSLLIISVEFSRSTNIQTVYCNIVGPDNKRLNSAPIILLDNGNNSNGDLIQNDLKYSAKFPFSELYLNGVYLVEYFVTDRGNNTKLIGQERFDYNNGQTNLPPSVENIILPNEVTRGVMFIFSVDASDPNGLNDIASVYFQLKRPDGTIVEAAPGFTNFSMYDDGNLELRGDSVANDGRYSFKNSFLETTQTGNWEFRFQARDRGNKLSNQITQTILVQ